MQFILHSFSILTLFGTTMVESNNFVRNSKAQGEIPSSTLPLAASSSIRLTNELQAMKINSQQATRLLQLFSPTPSPIDWSVFPPAFSPSTQEVATDAEVCEGILDTILKTDYERSMAPCSCNRQSESSEFQDGTFFIDCNYEYCEGCLESSELCGYLSGNYTYMENKQMPMFPIPTEINACVQYTAGIDDRLCLLNKFDFATYESTCQIQIGDQVCNSCELVSCSSDPSSSVTSKSDTDGEMAFSFDCTNIDGLYAMNMCDYVPYTNVELPPAAATDPLVFLRLQKDDWNTCTNSSPMVTTSSPVDNSVPSPTMNASPNVGSDGSPPTENSPTASSSDSSFPSMFKPIVILPVTAIVSYLFI